MNGSVAKLALRLHELWSHLPNNSAVVRKWAARERELGGPLPLAPSPLIGRWPWLQICEASEVSLPPPRELPPVPPASPMLALQACLPPPKESSPATSSARKRPKAAVESEKSAQSKLPCRFTRLRPMGAPRPLPLAPSPLIGRCAELITTSCPAPGAQVFESKGQVKVTQKKRKFSPCTLSKMKKGMGKFEGYPYTVYTPFFTRGGLCIISMSSCACVHVEPIAA